MGSSCAFAGFLATSWAVMPQQVLDPARRGEMAGLIRLREDRRDTASQRYRLLGREIPGEIGQEAHQVAHGGGRHRAVVERGEPALELGARGASRCGPVDEVSQSVRTDADLLGGPAQRQLGDCAFHRVAQYGHWNGRKAPALGCHSRQPGRAFCAESADLHGDTLANVETARKHDGAPHDTSGSPPASAAARARIVPGAFPSNRLLTRISASMWRRTTSDTRRSRSWRTPGWGSRMRS